MNNYELQFIVYSDLNIKFPTCRHAEIAYDVLRIDEEPKRSAVTKTLKLDKDQICV